MKSPLLFLLLLLLSDECLGFVVSGGNGASIRPRIDKLLWSSLTQTDETTATITAIDEPATNQAKETEEFVNDGPLSWMTTYLDKFGVKEGKALYYGPIPGDVDDAKRTSAEESAALRQAASKELFNINMDERQRRDKAGSVMLALSVAYISWASLIADDGGFGGHMLRFLSAIPLFLAFGYKRSAVTGLCNVAQAGLWDVDGNGLQKIDDPSLARAILDRVNDMNFDNLVKVVVPVSIFALVPQSTSAPLAFFLALFSCLFLVRDRIPNE